MSQESINLILGVALGFLASLFTTIVNNYFQDKREKNKRWWDRKEEVYSNIVDALYQLTNYYDLIISLNLGITPKTDEQKSELGKNIASYLGVIKKEATIGAFLISPKAEESLKNFLMSQETSYDSSEWIIELENALAYSKKCLQEIIVYAKDDLGVKK